MDQHIQVWLPAQNLTVEVSTREPVLPARLHELGLGCENVVCQGKKLVQVFLNLYIHPGRHMHTHTNWPCDRRHMRISPGGHGESGLNPAWHECQRTRGQIRFDKLVIIGLNVPCSTCVVRDLSSRVVTRRLACYHEL